MNKLWPARYDVNFKVKGFFFLYFVFCFGQVGSSLTNPPRPPQDEGTQSIKNFTSTLTLKKHYSASGVCFSPLQENIK